MVIRAVLGYRGYRITEAATAEEALKKFFDPANQYDLILMDLYLPDMSGKEALRKIRRWNPKAKAILLSATRPGADNTPELRGIEFLQKPFENKELIRLVRETLDFI
jgi:CheY-like chemotaxis protein